MHFTTSFAITTQTSQIQGPSNVDIHKHRNYRFQGHFVIAIREYFRLKTSDSTSVWAEENWTTQLLYHCFCFQNLHNEVVYLLWLLTTSTNSTVQHIICPTESELADPFERDHHKIFRCFFFSFLQNNINNGTSCLFVTALGSSISIKSLKFANCLWLGGRVVTQPKNSHVKKKFLQF